MKGNGARGVEGWTLGETVRLRRRAITGLAYVVLAVEESHALYTQICVNVSCLAGNKCIWRRANLALWMPVCNLRGWMPLWDDAYHGRWDDAVKESSPLHSALLGRIYDEVATFNEQPCVRWGKRRLESVLGRT